MQTSPLRKIAITITSLFALTQLAACSSGNSAAKPAPNSATKPPVAAKKGDDKNGAKAEPAKKDMKKKK